MKLPVEIEAWNQAHARLRDYLETFALGDQVLLERLTLRLLDEARTLRQADPALNPTTITLRHAQSTLSRWLAGTLTGEAAPSPQALTSGTVALLLSRMPQRQPEFFLRDNLPLEAREDLRRTLVVTGPDLTVSSMTPRHLDYGPMLDFARQTWHRYDAKTFGAAALFWLGVYGIAYWWLSEYL
jgi:hypothetical protein